MGGENIKPKASQIAAHCLFLLCCLFATASLCLWGWTLLALAGFVKSSLGDPAHALTVFAFTIAMLSAVLWFGKQIGIIKLKNDVAKGIWTVLIVAILASVAAAVATSLKSRAQSAPAAVDSAR